jgi:hypothetical protein
VRSGCEILLGQACLGCTAAASSLHRLCRSWGQLQLHRQGQPCEDGASSVTASGWHHKGWIRFQLLCVMKIHGTDARACQRGSRSSRGSRRTSRSSLGGSCASRSSGVRSGACHPISILEAAWPWLQQVAAGAGQLGAAATGDFFSVWVWCRRNVRHMVACRYWGQPLQSCSSSRQRPCHSLGHDPAGAVTAASAGAAV